MLDRVCEEGASVLSLSELMMMKSSSDGERQFELETLIRRFESKIEQEKIINQFLCIMFEQYPNLLVFNLAFVFSCFCLYFSLEIIDFSLASP